jgi:hypothetical protein
MPAAKKPTSPAAAALALRCCAAILVCLTPGIFASRSHAQSCHTVPSLRETSGLTYRVGLTSVLGSFQADAVSGEYQGLIASGTVAHPWFTAELSLPAYRIAKTGSHDYGFGDLSADVRGQLYRAHDGSLIAGPELAATFPTASSNDDLGMQHVMIMPGAFLAWQEGGFNLLAQVSYGRALAGASHHHMGPMPLVSPMNRSELAHAIGVSARLTSNLRVTGRLLGAINLFDHAGLPREVVAPGLQLVMGAFDASLELQLPVVGKPFTSRTLLSVGAQW